jgi:hypothetical protein
MTNELMHRHGKQHSEVTERRNEEHGEHASDPDAVAVR